MIYVEMDDSIRSTVEEKMAYIDSNVYNGNDFDIYFAIPHINVVCIDKEKIIAFACLAIIDGHNCMCYSWCEHSFKGKKAYLRGLRYLTSEYNIVLDDGTLPEYIRKRV